MLRIFLLTLLFSGLLLAEDAPDPAAGHSHHGKAFNEGPRQAARLMGGVGGVDFEITSKSAETKQFFLQGVGQLHGFWYFEAERSFRQAAVTDKECAMTYWGMAMANVDNDDRAADFARRAWLGRDSVTERERMYIDSLADFYEVEGEESPKRLQYL